MNVFLSKFGKKCLRGSPLCDMVPIVYGEYCYSCYKVVAICNWQENQVYYRM